MWRIILACALAGILAVPAKAQSLREQLIGAWSVVSCDPKFRAFTSACGTNPNGILMYDASGRYAIIIAARGRPNPTAGRNSPAEELKPLVTGLIAQFGTWSVNETDKTITVHIDGALFPNVEGTDGKATVSLSGDELKLVGGLGPSVWRRIKK